MKSTALLLFALALPAAAVAPAPAAPGAPPPITEPRNAAAGFAITSSLHVVGLTKLCEELPEPTHTRAQAARQAWAERNIAYVRAAHAWTDHVVAAIRVQSGDMAADGTRKTILDDLGRQANATLLEVFPARHADAPTCDRWAAILVNGGFDVRAHEEFGPLLEELAAVAWPEPAAAPES